MKPITRILACGLFGIYVAIAQNVTVEVGTKRYAAELLSGKDSTYGVTIAGIEYMLIRTSTVNQMLEKGRILEETINELRIVKTQTDSLLVKYGVYQNRADSHIQQQEKVIQLGDSLYRGYESLYRDFKRAVGFSTISLTAGIGAGFSPDSKLLFSLGGEYMHWSGQYIFGGGFKSVLVGFRLPL